MNYQILSKKHLVQTYVNRGLTIVRGKGCYLFDDEGRKYLDLMSNIGVNILGHANPKIVKAINDQAQTLTNLHGSFANDKRALAAEKLIDFCPKKLTRVFFCSSGTESVEAALKFARVSTGRKKFVAMKGGFHGKTFGALSATGNEKYRKPFEPLLQGFEFVELGNLKQLKKAVDENTAAVILEPIQGEGGIILPPEGYLKKVEKLCKDNNALLILDEIQSGMGRTGNFFAFEHESIKPDIVCLSKGLAAGVPIGATIVTEKVAEKIPTGSHTSTFGGNPLSTAVCLKTLEYIEENNLLEHVNKMGKYFIKELKSIKSDLIKEVRGKGLMLAIELKRNATPFLQALQKNGVIAAPSGTNVIRLLPPLVIEKEDVDFGVRILKKILT